MARRTVNVRLAEAFELMARYRTAFGLEHHAFAYLDAAETLRKLDRPVSKVPIVRRLPGFGPTLAGHTYEFLKTGKILELERLKELLPEVFLAKLEAARK
jgi:DNA polymerase/3'-5' exonuclease PolX